MYCNANHVRKIQIKKYVMALAVPFLLQVIISNEFCLRLYLLYYIYDGTFPEQMRRGKVAVLVVVDTVTLAQVLYCCHGVYASAKVYVHVYIPSMRLGI